MAARAVLTDLKAVAEQAGTVISSVLLGAAAATRVLPFTDAQLRQAIERSGIAVEINLKGFEAGVTAATESLEVSVSPGQTAQHRSHRGLAYTQSVLSMFSVIAAQCAFHRIYAGWGNIRMNGTHSAISNGCKRFFAAESIDEAIGDFPVTQEAARHLALWMTYEDIIRVAALKTDPERLTGIRKESACQRTSTRYCGGIP